MIAPLESGELHGQPQSFTFATTFMWFNTDRAKSNLFYTFALDKSRSIEVKRPSGRVIQASRMFGSKKVRWRTREKLWNEYFRGGKKLNVLGVIHLKISTSRKTSVEKRVVG